MKTDSQQLSELLKSGSSEFAAALLKALQDWAPGGPALHADLQQAAATDHPRRRRILFWEMMGERPSYMRTRLLTGVIASAFREEKEGLRLLFTFLCGRPTTYLYPHRIAELRNLRRVGRRLLFHETAGDEDADWLERLRALLPDACTQSGFDDTLAGFGERLLDILEKEKDLERPLPEDLGAFVMLEGEAASLRGGRLVEQAGDYDPKALAKLLPLVVALDEWQGDLQALAEKGAAALKHPLDQFIGEEDIKDWRDELEQGGSVPDIVLLNWITWMNRTELVGNEPAAWVALLRTLAPRQYRRTIQAALLLPQCWQSGQLQLSKKPPAELFPKKATRNGEDGSFWVDLGSLLWSEWVSPDGIPMSPAKWREETSPLLLLRSRLQDDKFCEMILNNDSWSRRHGVVEIIARGSRSLRVLLRIARTRKFYTGAANRGVPLALLENPSNIPITALRTFLSTRYISRFDLVHLARGGPDMREEVSQEAKRLSKRI